MTWLTWFGAYYQESKNFVFAVPIDTDTYFDHAQGRIHRRAMRCAHFAGLPRRRIGNVALMKKFGWKIGDKLPLHSTIWTNKADGSLNWTFDIVGIFDAKDPTQATQQASTVLFHYELFDEGRSFGKGQVGWDEERIDDPAQSAAVSARIDALFANSPNETKTQPAKDFAIAFIKQLGDVGFVLRAILGAVFFTLLFLTGNTMMQSGTRAHPGARRAEDAGLHGRKGARAGHRRVAAALRAGAIAGLALSYAVMPIVALGLQGVDLSHGAQPLGSGSPCCWRSS